MSKKCRDKDEEFGEICNRKYLPRCLLTILVVQSTVCSTHNKRDLYVLLGGK